MNVALNPKLLEAKESKLPKLQEQLEHPALTFNFQQKPHLILDNQTLTEVKEQVQQYASKLTETINRLEEEAKIYKQQNEVEKAVLETQDQMNSAFLVLFQQIMAKLSLLTGNAELEREVLVKINAELNK